MVECCLRTAATQDSSDSQQLQGCSLKIRWEEEVDFLDNPVFHRLVLVEVAEAYLINNHNKMHLDKTLSSKPLFLAGTPPLLDRIQIKTYLGAMERVALGSNPPYSDNLRTQVHLVVQ
jgi:hypothetical protein